jgi:hypothetical protein
LEFGVIIFWVSFQKLWHGIVVDNSIRHMFVQDKLKNDLCYIIMQQMSWMHFCSAGV